MFGIGIPELVLILIVGLIVFGPGKLPEVGRAVGKGIREFRKASNAFQAILNEPDPPPKTASQQPQQQPQQQSQQNPPQSAPTQQNNATEAPAADTPASQQTSAATTQTSTAASTDIPYTPPTQESVRQELAAKKEA